MMEQLIDRLHGGECQLVVLHEGGVRMFNGRGARTLYNILEQSPELLHGAKLACKAVGRTAAKAMVEGGVAEVYAGLISDQGFDVLHDAGISTAYGRRVNHSEFLRIWERMGEEAAV